MRSSSHTRPIMRSSTHRRRPLLPAAAEPSSLRSSAGTTYTPGSSCSGDTFIAVVLPSGALDAVSDNYGDSMCSYLEYTNTGTAPLWCVRAPRDKVVRSDPDWLLSLFAHSGRRCSLIELKHAPFTVFVAAGYGCAEGVGRP